MLQGHPQKKTGFRFYKSRAIQHFLSNKPPVTTEQCLASESPLQSPAFIRDACWNAHGNMRKAKPKTSSFFLEQWMGKVNLSFNKLQLGFYQKIRSLGHLATTTSTKSSLTLYMWNSDWKQNNLKPLFLCMKKFFNSKLKQILLLKLIYSPVPPCVFWAFALIREAEERVFTLYNDTSPGKYK